MHHTCNWPGCQRDTPSPSRWGCTKHWRALPWYLKLQVLALYSPTTSTPSYQRLERDIRQWVWDNRIRDEDFDVHP